MFEHYVNVAVLADNAAVNPYGALAVSFYRFAVRNYKEGKPLLLQFGKFFVALFVECNVAYCQDFVYQQYFRFHVYGYRKAQPCQHTRRIRLNGRVYKVAKFRKFKYGGYFFFYFFFGVSEYRCIEVNVFKPRRVAVEARAKAQEGGYSAVPFGVTGTDR